MAAGVPPAAERNYVAFPCTARLGTAWAGQGQQNRVEARNTQGFEADFAAVADDYKL
jgi:hypothetical protein